MQGPVGCFSYNTGGRDDLQLGETVHFTHPPFPDNSSPADGAVESEDDEQTESLAEPEVSSLWSAAGVVVGVSVGGVAAVVAVALQYCDTGLLALDFTQQEGYRVLPQRLSVETERMQTRLGIFVYDEVTSCSFRVQQAILGQPVPPSVAYIIAPQSASGCPLLSSL